MIRTHPWTAEGTLGVEIAQAIYAFEAGCTPLLTSPIAEGAALLMADGDGDARPDLWEIDASGDAVSVTIHTHASGFSERLRPRISGSTAGAGALFLAGDYDRDGSSDLFVLRPGGRRPGGVGRSGLQRASRRGRRCLRPGTTAGGSPWATTTSTGCPTCSRSVPTTRPVPRSWPGRSGYAGAPTEITTAVSGHDGAFAVGDLDGDGRPDLYFLDPDGSLTVYLGGQRGDASDEDLIYWFVEGDDQPTTRQEACPVVP